MFAGFGVGQAGAQSGAVPLGAMQLSRCPDRSRLDAVTMPEGGPIPNAKLRPAPGIWGSWLVSCLDTPSLVSLSLSLSLCADLSQWDGGRVGVQVGGGWSVELS